MPRGHELGRFRRFHRGDGLEREGLLLYGTLEKGVGAGHLLADGGLLLPCRKFFKVCE